MRLTQQFKVGFSILFLFLVIALLDLLKSLFEMFPDFLFKTNGQLRAAQLILSETRIIILNLCDQIRHCPFRSLVHPDLSFCLTFFLSNILTKKTRPQPCSGEEVGTQNGPINYPHGDVFNV